MTQDAFFLACGMLSAALSTCAFLPYLRDMVRGAARPLRSTWLIWTVISAISAASNISAGADNSLLFVCVQAGFTALIFLMSLRYGMGSFVHRPDAKILGAAAIGLALWWLTESATWALAIAILVSALGGGATIVKTYHAPQSEPYSCWIISSVAAFLAILSVGSLNPVLLAYPVYLFVLYTGIIISKRVGTQAHTQKAQVQMRPIPLLLAPRQRVGASRPNIGRSV